MSGYLKNKLKMDEQLVNYYDELPFWSAPFGLKLLEKVDYRRDLKVLDIGCGCGFPLIEIAERLGSSSTVYGIDPWKDGLERISAKLKAFGIKNVSLIEGQAESLPLENGSIDLIVSNNGLNNVRDIDGVISECERVSRVGAQLIFTLNLDGTMMEFYRHLEGCLKERGMDAEIEAMYLHIRKKRPPVEAIARTLQRHGYLIKDFEYDQFNYLFADGSAVLNHHFIRLAFIDSWVSLLPADKMEEIFSAIEMRLNEEASAIGGLKLSIPFVVINCLKG